MANDKIDNEIFATILRIRKNNNLFDLEKKSLDFGDVKESH